MPVSAANILIRSVAPAIAKFSTSAIGTTPWSPTFREKVVSPAAHTIPICCRIGTRRATSRCSIRNPRSRKKPRIVWFSSRSRNHKLVAAKGPKTFCCRCRKHRQTCVEEAVMKVRAFLVFCCPALLLLCCLATPPRALCQQSVPEILFDSTPDLLKLPDNLYLGEASGVAVNSQGHIFVFSRRHDRSGIWRRRRAAPRVRSRRQIHSRDRPPSLRLGLRAYRESRSRRQHLGHRQRHRHGHQVQPRWPRGPGVWSPPRSFRRRHRTAQAPKATAASGRRPVPASHRRGVGRRRQYLHKRRLRQFARR